MKEYPPITSQKVPKMWAPRAFEIAPYQWLLYISNSSPFPMEMIIKIILVLPLSSLYIVDLDEKEFCFLKKSPKHNQEEL